MANSHIRSNIFLIFRINFIIILMELRINKTDKGYIAEYKESPIKNFWIPMVKYPNTYNPVYSNTPQEAIRLATEEVHRELTANLYK